MKKPLKYLLITSLLISFLALPAIHFIAPYAILIPFKRTLSTTPDQYDLDSESLKIQTTDGLQLDGYRIKSDIDITKGVLILVHGIGGYKESFLGLSKELAQRGIESFLFDGRAHGKSGGQYCTYGVKEKQDISKIIDYIRQIHPNLKIGIWGNSLGGAIAIQSLEADPRLAFGVIESTFTKLDQIVYDYKKRILQGIAIRAISDYALQRAGKIAGFDPHQVKPIQSVQQIEQPVLIAHGNADPNISVEYGKQLFEQLKTSEKELVIVEGGKHADLMATGGSDYKDQLINFIEQHIE